MVRMYVARNVKAGANRRLAPLPYPVVKTLNRPPGPDRDNLPETWKWVYTGIVLVRQSADFRNFRPLCDQYKSTKVMDLYMRG